MLKEHFPHIKVDIIATDLDDKVLLRAQEGQYKKQALKDLPKQFQDKYFEEENGIYEVEKSLKKSIMFKKHNLLLDKYPQNIDLIICCNVLIYFTDEAKNMIYQNFSNSLVDNGILFVGSTEQIFNPDEYKYQVFDTYIHQKVDMIH